MRAYLIFLILFIMAAGARTMFEIAFAAMSREHDFAPSEDIVSLIVLVVWYIATMMTAVLMLRKKISANWLYVFSLSLAIMLPSLYMLLKHR